MNPQRTPPTPRTRVISESGNASGSVPNLPSYCTDDSYRNVNIFKRKERTEEMEYKKEFAIFRTEMMSFLEKFGETQNENLKYIKSEISEIKNEIKTMKANTENFTQRLDQINSEMKEMKDNNTTIQNKMKHMEEELNQLKNQQNSDCTTPKSPVLCQQNLIHEIKAQCDREKNVVIVGISEINERNANSRRNHDNNEAMKIITTLYKDCPKPTKTIRLGKYIPNKNRPLKVCFNSSDIPKYLLRNKKNLQDKIQIYADQTPAQKEYLQLLKAELNKRIEDGEGDLIIKYIKGIPTITMNKTNQKNQ